MERHVVYSGTPNLYEPMVWAAKSLVYHTKVDGITFLIEDDVFPYELPDIIRCINVKEYEEEQFPPWGKNSKTHFTKMALVRVCYPELLPDFDTVLQLDVDTIVLDDISPIWETDLDGKWFAACHEAYSGYDPYHSHHYYNVGVCLFNLAQMREDNAQAQIVNWINTTKANCVEQDALNFLGAMRGKAVDLPMRYNENRAVGYTDDPAIQHYLGYMDWITNPRLPRREYLKLYRDMEWKEVLHG